MEQRFPVPEEANRPIPSWLWIAKDKRFMTGATIPYLPGALRLERNADEVAPEHVSRNELRGLLTSMRDDLSPPDSVAIQHCGYVDGYVAAWHSPPPQNRGRIPSTNHPDRGLYHCDAVYGHQILDFESVFEELWQGQGIHPGRTLLARMGHRSKRKTQAAVAVV